MKLQAHLPTVSIGAREWHATTIALASLLGTAVLLLASQSSGLLNNLLFERFRPPSITHSRPDFSHRVSLDLHSLGNPIDPTRRFSVAHPLPVNVASPQPFSIGSDARVSFEVFGETAHSEMLADGKTMPQLQPRNDRLMLMLMLLRLHQHRQ